MLAELRTLVAIARFGTFSLAAERSGLTQAAVSGQIKRLETALGFALFDRTGRSAKLNAAGARTLERAKAIFALVDSIGDPEGDGAVSTLRIGAIASVQSSMLARALAAFRERYVNVRVHVAPGLSLHLIDQVDAGELDIAILIKPPFELPAELSWQPISRDPYVLIAPHDCEGDDWKTLIQSQPFLRYDRLSFGGRQVDRFVRNLPFTVVEAIEVPVQAMLAMVQSGLGVALIPLAEAHFPLPSGVRSIPLEGVDLYREVGFILARREPAPVIATHFAECLATSAKAWMAESQASDADDALAKQG